MSLKFIFSAAICLAAAQAFAQDAAKPEIKVEMVNLKVENQFTPQLQATNVVEKRWKPKTWLELQVDFKAKVARSLGGREGTYPALEMKYYLALAGVKTKEGKQVVLSGSITYKDVPNEECHALAYVAPSTLKRLLLKENGGKVDVAASAVEILAGGEVVGGKSNGPPGKWWESDKVSVEEAILSKEKTPFAPFWGDFDLAAGK